MNIMSCQFRSYSGYAFVFLVGLTLIPGYQLFDRSGQAAVTDTEITVESVQTKPAQKASEALYVAQAYSSTCLTSNGSCSLPRPQPVGSGCSCGGQSGRVVQ